MKLRHLALVTAACLAVPALADVKSGYDMWNRGDYFGAVKEWRPLAIAGNPEAQYNLAQAYKLGRGVPTDLQMAESWYAKAAAQGHQPSRDNYGLILFQNGNRSAAMPYIEESAGRGEPRAQYVLGTALFNGDGMAKDWVRAYALMTRASASGLTAASTSLAQMDKYIPLDQRQRGLALARSFEEAAQRPGLASAGGGTLIGSEALPPSQAAVGAPPVREAMPMPVPRPIRPRPPVPTPTPMPAEPVEVATRPAPPRPGPRPVARPVPVPVAAAPSGNWKVQLAAFGNASNANGLWNNLHARIGALGPYRAFVVQAGPITRLQAGPLASKAAAEKLCASVRAAGQACIAVAP